MSGQKYQRHFFVCQMDRPPGSKPSCRPRGAAAVYNTLNEGLGAHSELWGNVQVSSSGCLGPCHRGPVVVVYPEGTWYVDLDAAAAREIVEKHLVGGEPVERLRYDWPSDDD